MGFLNKGVRAVDGVTRRQFGSGVLASAAIVAAVGTLGLSPAVGQLRLPAFELRHGDDVMVWIGAGETFTVEVIERATGAVLERVTDINAGGLLRTTFEHVEFFRIRPPGT